MKSKRKRRNSKPKSKIFKGIQPRLPKNELASEPMRRALTFMCRLFRKTRDQDLECGALYHAAHALAIYRDRRWGDSD